jgi:hypothetical protein
MKLATTDEERAALRADLVKLDDDIAAGWDTIEEGLKTPPAPEPEPPKQYTVADLKAINAARVYISRAVNKYDAKNREKIIERVNTLITLKSSVKKETRDKLIELNVIDQNSNLVGE